MEWIVTTGKSIEEAKELALDQLGVTEDDAEFEVLEEAKPGLFGRFRKEVRVRARVRPVQPRPKTERRRKRSSGGGGDRDRSTKGAGSRSSRSAQGADGTAKAPKSSPKANAEASSPRTDPSTAGATPAPTTADAGAVGPKGAPVSDVEIPLSEHLEKTRGFVDGLLDAFGLEAEVSVQVVDEEAAEVRVDGDNLGVLIGPGGNTLQAIQTLSRASVQRPRETVFAGRVFIEVGGYRQKRKEALERFTRDLVEQVRSSGVEKALEPMGSADRKVVHDTVNECEGVHTISVGEEPRRRVVITPDAD